MNVSAEELASRYVLDQLDAHARADFEARLLREPELVALVREFEAGLEQGVRALPRRHPPAGLLARIERQIDSETARPSTGASPLRGLKFAGWGLAAVIALSLATLAVQSLRPPLAPAVVIVGLDANRATTRELTLQTPSGDADARFMQLASLAQDLWEQPARRPVSGGAAADASRGYALFDPGSRQGFIAIEKLPALEPKQRYHLWVADALTGRVRDAGVLPLAGSSRGLYSFALAPAADVQSASLRFFVTVESATDRSPPSQPHGTVVLGDGRL